MSVFTPLLNETGLPEAAIAPLEKKLVEAYDLIVLNNSRIAQVNAAKADDPNNVENLDSLWKAEEKNPAISEKIEQFYVIAEQYEKFLTELRDFAKNNLIKERLSDEQVAATKKLVNESAPTIAEAKAGAAAMALVVDSVLKDKAPAGGILSLLPEVESLKNARGRKANAGGIPIYMTRVGNVEVDGVSTNRDGKGKFDYAAAVISEKFGEKIHPENKVTAATLEEEYFKALEIPFRSKKSGELPVKFDFTFTKTVKVRNANDDGTTDIPKSVKVTVYNTDFGTETETPKVEAETPKVETPAKQPEAPKVPNAEKKAAAAKATPTK